MTSSSRWSQGSWAAYTVAFNFVSVLRKIKVYLSMGEVAKILWPF